MNKEESNAKKKAYIKAHPEQRKETTRRWRESHKEELKKSKHEYYSKNKDKYLEYGAKSRKKNPEKRKQLWANWAQRNPGKLKAKEARRQALEQNAEGSWEGREFENLVTLLGNMCVKCLKAFTTKNPPTPDHIVPLANGGTNWIENIQPMHRGCNSGKKNRDDTDLRMREIHGP